MVQVILETYFGLFDELSERRKGNCFVEGIYPGEGEEAVVRGDKVPIHLVGNI